ncbi:MAG: ATP-binding protein [Myxococcales bacterium]|nr:ATP-binding protein [Myxococcales bacterium]
MNDRDSQHSDDTHRASPEEDVLEEQAFESPTLEAMEPFTLDDLPPPPPFADVYRESGEQLRDYLGLLGHFLKKYLGIYGRRLLQAGGTLSDLYVSVEEANALLAGNGSSQAGNQLREQLGWPHEAEVSKTIQAHSIFMEAKRRTTRDEDLPKLAIEVLRGRFHLSERQVILLIAAAAPALSVDLARLYSFSWADFAIKLPSVGFLSELVAETPAHIPDIVKEFREYSPLVRSRLITLADSPNWGSPTPLLHRSVRVPDRVTAFLQQQAEAMSALAASVSLFDDPGRATTLEALVIPDSTVTDLRVAVDRAITSGAPRLLLIGPPGAGRRTSLAAAFAEHGWGTLTIELGVLPADPVALEDALVELAREALLKGCCLHIRGDSVFGDRETLSNYSRPLNKVFDGYTGPLALSANRPEARIYGIFENVFDVPFPLAKAAQQRALWETKLREAQCVSEEDAPALLTQRFSLTPGAIHRAVWEAKARASLLGEDSRNEKGQLILQVPDLSRAIRRKTDHALGNIAEPFSTSLTWDDVVLPDRVLSTLKEIQSYARHREKVYDNWGFRRKMSYGRGLSCLFSGPPGTGKTMMAAVLAESLGRELYRVDVSRIMSKWVGETEKNLGTAFDEAERGQIVLLFDEADSLFAKRTKGQSSQDRYVNLEVNYLLQRMENFDGVSILTTNNEKNIDEAFKRRLKFKVNFPLPKSELRAELWRSMVPPEAAIEENIEWEWLGKRFEMSGGNIKNAVLRAAFYAAEGDGVITHDLLYQAAIAESREMGKVVRDDS